MSPRPDVSEERRNQIMDAAMKVFARVGLHKARMDDIARESRLSKGLLYWYFSSKEELIGAIFDRILARELEDLRGLLDEDGSVVSRLEQINHQVSREIKQLKPVLPLLYEFFAASSRQKGVHEALKRYYDTYVELLCTLVQQGIERGEFRPMDPKPVAISIVGMFEGLMLLYALSPDTLDVERQNLFGLRLLVAGLKVEE